MIKGIKDLGTRRKNPVFILFFNQKLLQDSEIRLIEFLFENPFPAFIQDRVYLFHNKFINYVRLKTLHNKY
jgi:hypothetical protein